MNPGFFYSYEFPDSYYLMSTMKAGVFLELFLFI